MRVECARATTRLAKGVWTRELAIIIRLRWWMMGSAITLVQSMVAMGNVAAFQIALGCVTEEQQLIAVASVVDVVTHVRKRSGQ